MPDMQLANHLFQVRSSKATASIEDVARCLVVQIINGALDSLTDDNGQHLTAEEKARLRMSMEKPDTDMNEVRNISFMPYYLTAPTICLKKVIPKCIIAENM